MGQAITTRRGETCQRQLFMEVHFSRRNYRVGAAGVR